MDYNDGNNIYCNDKEKNYIDNNIDNNLDDNEIMNNNINYINNDDNNYQIETNMIISLVYIKFELIIFCKYI